MTEKIIIITHPSRPTTYFKPDGWLVTIGSAPGNDLVLPGADVAARHARLEEKDGRWLALDMDSSSGTYIDTNALLPGNPEELLADQRLRIGEYSLELRDGPIPGAAEPPPVAAPEPVPTRPRPVPAVLMRLIPAVAVVTPGEPAEFALEIDNQSEEQLELRLRAEGIPSVWITLDVGHIRLLPRQTLRVPVMVQSPDNSSAAAGRHELQILAESAQQTDIVAAAAAITLTPFERSSVTLVSSPLRHGEAGAIRVSNEGNSPTSYQITASDAAHELDFDLPQSSVALEAGQEETIPITATARKRPLMLNQKVLPIEVRARSDSVNMVTMGRVIVPPVLPPIALLLLAVPLLLALLFAGRAYLCRDEYEGVTNATYNAICGRGPVEAAAPAEEPATPATEEAIAASDEQPPTLTPATIPPTVTPTIDPILCEGALQTRLTVGEPARVIITTGTLNLRSEPRIDEESDNRVCQLRNGRVVDVIDGPSCDGEGQRWYLIRSRDAVRCTLDTDELTIAEGWAVEESGDIYFLEPVQE